MSVWKVLWKPNKVTRAIPFWCAMPCLSHLRSNSAISLFSMIKFLPFALIFEGSSKGDDGVYLYEPHSRPINCMLFDPSNCGKLYTASYDGTIRCCDITSATFQEVSLSKVEQGFSFLCLKMFLMSVLLSPWQVLQYRQKARFCCRTKYFYSNVHTASDAEFSTGWEFVCFSVRFTRNHLNRTKI